MNCPEAEGKNKGYEFLFVTHVPSTGAPHLFLSWNMYAWRLQWELLQGKPSPSGPFIFSSKLSLLSYVYSMENICKQVIPSA